MKRRTRGRHLDPLRKRDALYSEQSTPEILQHHGRIFWEDGLVADALEFFGAARDDEGIAQVRSIAIETGDSFLLRRMEKIEKSWVTPDDWDRLADKAWEMGKYHDAREGYSRGTNKERLRMAEEKLGIARPEHEEEESGQKPADSGTEKKEQE